MALTWTFRFGAAGLDAREAGGGTQIDSAHFQQRRCAIMTIGPVEDGLVGLHVFVEGFGNATVVSLLFCVLIT
jgi:hypothetical protein